MQYLCLMYLDRGLTPPADAVAQYGALRQAMTDAAVFVASGQLQDDTESAVVRIEDDDRTVVDGALDASATAPGAFYLIDCVERNEALAWAARIPAAKYGSVEVRPLRAAPGPVTSSRS